MAVPDTHDFADGIFLSSEANAYIRDPIRFLLNRPVAELRQSATQSLSNTTWTSITYDVEDLDTDAAHSTSSNTSRFTAPYAGWYQVSGGVEFAVSATGQRGVAFAVNGTLVNASRVFVSATAATGMSVPARTKLVFLNVGDYVEVQAWQNSGGALNTFSSAEAASSMSVVWVRNG